MSDCKSNFCQNYNDLGLNRLRNAADVIFDFIPPFDVGPLTSITARTVRKSICCINCKTDILYNRYVNVRAEIFSSMTEHVFLDKREMEMFE